MKSSSKMNPFSRSLFLALLIISGLSAGNLNAQTTMYYQIKIYSLESEIQEQRMDTYLKDAFLPAMHRAGVSRVGVFKPVGQDTSLQKRIFVLIPLKSLDQLEKLPLIINEDKKYLADGKDYIEADYKNAPYGRIESILLKAFTGMPELGIPNHSTPPSERIYELRSYQGATEKYFQKKVEMFNEGGEIKLFRELGFNAVFYGEVISGKTMPNLMYMTTFSNEASQKEHWAAFQSSPVWKELKEVEKYKNTVSKVEKFLLFPTEYSDI